MSKPPLEVADIIRALADCVTGIAGLAVSAAQRRVLHRLAACRTASLSGHIGRCDGCEHERIAYNSCRKALPEVSGRQACPAVRGVPSRSSRRQLLPRRLHRPGTVGCDRAANKRVLDGVLFRAASATLIEIAADARHLGARIGLVAVLHTWSQRFAALRNDLVGHERSDDCRARL
ncbi:MAG: transposase zinc-binding domain-containing protein [Deltaproteobacteria bacterium]|nr:transposase zinc-binding domain-containing protein [Deltaproteobacteria bacterium]